MEIGRRVLSIPDEGDDGDGEERNEEEAEEEAF